MQVDSGGGRRRKDATPKDTASTNAHLAKQGNDGQKRQDTALVAATCLPALTMFTFSQFQALKFKTLANNMVLDYECTMCRDFCGFVLMNARSHS